MGQDSGYFQLAGRLWDWAKQDIGVWMRALGNLKLLIMERDLETDETLVFALRFSALSVIIAILVDLPPRIFFFSGPVNLLNTIGLFVLYYIDAFFAAVSAKMIASAIRIKTSFRICFTLALFCTVYWPVVNFGNYIVFSDKEFYKAGIAPFSASNMPSFLEQKRSLIGGLVFMYLITNIFIVSRLVPVTKTVFNVGNVRATVMVVGTATLLAISMATLLSPLWLAIFKTEYGN